MKDVIEVLSNERKKVVALQAQISEMEEIVSGLGENDHMIKINITNKISMLTSEVIGRLSVIVATEDILSRKEQPVPQSAKHTGYAT